MKKLLSLTIVIGILLCGCSFEDINRGSDFVSNIQVSSSLETSNYSDNSEQAEVNTKPERNINPNIGEKFYCYPLVKSGTLNMTVTGAEYYDNVLDAGVKIENFDDEFLKSNWFDSDTGEIFTSDGVEYTFILVHITIENVDATSPLNEEMYPFYKGFDPKLFPENYCGDYDFSVSHFGINTDIKSNALDTNNLGCTGVDYFSLKGQCYTDYYRSFLFNLEPGNSISFDIGRIVFKSIANEGMVQSFGGKIGDNLIPRYLLNLTNSPHDPCVKLGLK